MRMTSSDDRAGASCEPVFRALYTAHVDAVLGYALRRVAAPEDAADVVAETFLVGWRRLDELTRAEQPRLWLYGVARRVLANQRRGGRRRDDLGRRLRTELPVVVPDHAEHVAAVTTFRAALRGLRRLDREVLELTLWEELSPQEVAVALGISPGAVRTRLSRARARLRDVLDPAAGDEPDRAGHQPGDQPSRASRGVER
jgi:RNA polymerase sigma-70 factor (ECF subfamily)